MIAMLLFIDFRKAFDLVNSSFLTYKLFHYGFGNNSLRLIQNYFYCRQQQTKVGTATSSLAPIKLGVPQGSVLGPLFFLLFINDLAFYLDQFECIMFADDTTLYKQHTNLDALINKFTSDITALQTWCNFNQIDINWSKTFIMFVTNKRIKPPKHIKLINEKDIEVVTTFKLLGVKLDNKLKFDAFTSEVRNRIVQRMHSIKKLFQLSTSVKLQFFKSFLLPYFDYCSTLSIYYSKTAIQRMCNCFNLCLFKLFGIKNEATTNEQLNDHNNKLEKFGLHTFEHRLMSKMATFIHKVINNNNAPVELKLLLTAKSTSTQPTMQLRESCQNTLTHKITNINSRHKNALHQPTSTSKVGDLTFDHFFSSFVNNIIVKDIHQRFNFFKTIIFNNINLLFLKFVKLFPKFDLINKNFDYLLRKKDEK
jgi:hypothetical protein